MTVAVTFNLGPAAGITARQLTITRMHRAGDDAAPAAAIDTDVGAVTTSTQTIARNTVFQAVLVDTHVGGGTSRRVLNFHTGELQYHGPVAGSDDTKSFYIIEMQDLSSSSSSSSSVSSTSSSSSSVSSSSSSSVSSSSSST